MDKLKYIKIENPDGSYSDSIPLAVDSNYVNVNGNTLTNELRLKATKIELNTLSSVVDTKVNPSDLQSVNNNLQSQINSLASGSPAGVYETEEDLEIADPDHSKIYVVSENGHWYYYNEEWTDGGIYQTAMIDMDDAMAHIRVLEDNFDIDITPNSNDFILTDSASGFIPHDDEGNPKEIKFGDRAIEQFVTTGKNLLPITFQSYTHEGITYTKNNDGTVTVNGTSTAVSFINLTDGITYTLPAGTYTLSGCPSGGSDNTYRLDINDGYIAKDYGDGGTFTLNEETTLRNIRIRMPSGKTVNNLIFKPMIEVGSTATEFEKYTGGQPSPNPDYPQNINVVEGESEVVESNKNLFRMDGKGTYTINGVNFVTNGDGSVTANGTSTDYIYAYVDNQDYIVSTNISSIDAASTVVVPANVPVTLSGGSANLRLRLRNQTDHINDSVGNITKIYDSEKNVTIMFYIVPNTTVNETIYPMLELNSTATSYISYKGNTFPITLPTGMFLGKIGESSNYIYGTKDNWKLHSGLRKVIFNGSENWQLGERSETSEGVFFLTGFISNYGFQNSNGNFISNYAQHANYARYVYLFDTMYGQLRFRSPTFNYSTNDWKALISNNNLIVIGILQTSTETDITDTTLISQLNNIADNLQTYKGGTIVFTTSGNLEPSIQFDYMVNPFVDIEARLSALEEEASI